MFHYSLAVKLDAEKYASASCLNQHQYRWKQPGEEGAQRAQASEVVPEVRAWVPVPEAGEEEMGWRVRYHT